MPGGEQQEHGGVARTSLTGCVPYNNTCNEELADS